MDKHWAREAVETTGDLARAKKLQENVRQSPEKEMKSISRSIEALERILPAISSCLLTWSNPDSPRKRQGNERQASRRRAEQVERGGTSEISRAHSTDGQSTLQESTVGRPGSDWQTQPWSPLPFQAASAHISIAAATSILASPSAMVSMTPSKNEESRIVHLVRYQHPASALAKSSPSFLPPSLPVCICIFIPLSFPFYEIFSLHVPHLLCIQPIVCAAECTKDAQRAATGRTTLPYPSTPIMPGSWKESTWTLFSRPKEASFSRHLME